MIQDTIAFNITLFLLLFVVKLLNVDAFAGNRKPDSEILYLIVFLCFETYFKSYLASGLSNLKI